MEERARDKKRNPYFVLCALAAATALFPLACDYIMEGGIVAEWVARVKEIAEGFRNGNLHMFSGLEVRMATGITVNAMNSNFWFFIPGILYLLTEDMVLAYRIFMLLVQVCTFLGALLCFKRIFHQRRIGLGACMGVILYMTNPYRIYVCYDKANLSQAVAWMLLPLYVWAIYGLFGGDISFKDFLIAALALAGIGYADAVFFIAVAGITILTEIAARKPFPCTAVAAGCLLSFPELLRLGRHLFTEEFAEWEMPLQMIMQKGYHFGQFFSSYAFRDEKPGMGLGMMICLLTLLWLKLVRREKETDMTKRYFLYIALVFAVLSLSCFPWDVLQRMGVWSIKLISLIGTPAVFWGMAMAAFCVPASGSLERVAQCENKFAANMITVMVVLFCVGICVYQCNTLTFGRLPMNIG